MSGVGPPWGVVVNQSSCWHQFKCFEKHFFHFLLRLFLFEFWAYFPYWLNTTWLASNCLPFLFLIIFMKWQNPICLLCFLMDCAVEWIENVSPESHIIFFSKIFLAFKSTVHFEALLEFICWPVWVRFVEMIVLSSLNHFCTLPQSVRHNAVGFFLDILFCFSALHVCSPVKTTVPWLLCLYKIRSFEPSRFILFETDVAGGVALQMFSSVPLFTPLYSRATALPYRRPSFSQSLQRMLGLLQSILQPLQERSADYWHQRYQCLVNMGPLWILATESRCVRLWVLQYAS